MSNSKTYNYILTKTLIKNGIQCEKRLWLDFNEPKKVDLNSQIYAGNRFGDKLRKLDTSGLDLSKLKTGQEALDETNKFIKEKEYAKIKKIYESVFIFNDTLVRPDVLIRSKDGWELWEAKTKNIKKDKKDKTKYKIDEIDLIDIAIQYYVINSCGINITNAKLVCPDDRFIYEGNEDYKNLIKSFDVTEAVKEESKSIPQYIEKFKKLASPSSDCPDIPMEKNKCKHCIYKPVCESELKKDNEDVVDYNILPGQLRKALKEYIYENNITTNIQDIPLNDDDLLSPKQKIVLKAHVTGEEHFDSKELKNILHKCEWPFYFMDFEFVSQTVPIIRKTTAYENLPFQWSVHKWNNIEEDMKIEEGSHFLDFSSNDIELKFLESLLKALGNKGSIFVFRKSVEANVLKHLMDKEICKHYSDQIKLVISRIVDAHPLAEKYYYNTKMRGSYSLKKIIKSIPTNVSYDDEEDINDGMRANLAWFKCTDPDVSKEDKDMEQKLLLEYCAKDTYAMYDLVKYWMNK